jgi:predicted metal-dependent hydrolase
VAVSDRARRARITIDRRDGAIKLVLPRGMSLDEGRRVLKSGTRWIKRQLRQAEVERSEPAIDWIQARRALVERLNQLARRHGFAFNKVFIKRQKTLWGSCSSKNNINLNANLMGLPAELRDYVLIHELVHTRHKHHGKGFWREVSRICGDGKTLQRKLRKYKP